MSKEPRCYQCKEEISGKFLRIQHLCDDLGCSHQGQYKHCCLDLGCLMSAAEADDARLDILVCAGCGENIRGMENALVLPGGRYVDADEQCLTEYLVKYKNAERSEEFYE